MRKWKTVVGLAAAVAIGCLRAGPATAGTIVVNTISLEGWAFHNEGPFDSVGTVSLVPGPGTPPVGIGSARQEVDDQGRSSFGTFAYKGTPLSSITQLTFASYASSQKHLSSIALQFDIDYDATDADTSYRGRLFFVPTGTPPADTWVTHDALAGTWAASQAPGNTVCPQNAPCTWAQVLAAFPNAAIRNDPIQLGALLFRLGGPITGGAIAYVDDFTIAIDGVPTTYDFEPGATVNPSIAPPGTVITVEAYGFKSGVDVNVFYYTNLKPPAGKKRVRICRGPAWDTPDLPPGVGKFYCAVPVPPASVAGPPGVHNVVITGRAGYKRGQLVYTTATALP